MQEALYAQEVALPLLPTWVPEGFEISEMDASSEEEAIHISYTKGNDSIICQASVFSYTGVYVFERSGPFLETFERNGMTFYIFKNFRHMQAVWMNGRYICSIAGDLSFDEMIKMINTIGGENGT